MKSGVIYILLLFLLACKSNPYPDYSKANDGAIYYRLFMFGDDRHKPEAGAYITADIAYQTMDDSIFFRGKRTFQLAKSEFDGSIEECFMMLAEDDSASFIISADGLFAKTLDAKLPSFIPENSNMKVGIRMHMIRSAEEYRREKEEFLAWIEDFGEYEQTVLRHFIEEQKIDIKPTESGMYFIPLNQSNGEKVEKGDIVTVNYEGKFLNGEFFDSTVKRKQPFEFVYGTEWQVIEGMEEAIGLMREGQKALIILPSDLAWGADGSSTGIVPPFTSVIYELELIQVRSREEQV